MKILYEQFLKKKNIYHLAKGYWKRIVSKELERNGIKYESYLNDRFKNGCLFYDGNPIFNALLQDKKKAFRIVQEDYEEFGEYFKFFLEEKENYEELVLVLTLTDNTRDKAIEKIRDWIKS